MLLCKTLSPGMPSKTDKSDIQLLGELVRGDAVPCPGLPLRLLDGSRFETWQRRRGWEPDTSCEYGSGASELPTVVDGAAELSLMDPPASG